MHQLLIEASTERGVIAGIHEGSLIFSIELPFGLNQSKFLMPSLVKAIQDHAIDPAALDCIGVGIGPGSYTGIRIGVAVAQAFAYAWKIPLIGVCSLDPFVPEEQEVPYVSILDARIGGAYVRKGIRRPSGVDYLSEPQVMNLEELGPFLKDVSLLVTPYMKTIKARLDSLYPDHEWIWQEIAPSPLIMASAVSAAYDKGLWKKEGHLELLYLRETEAERNRKEQKS